MQGNGLAIKNSIDQDQHQHGEQNAHAVGDDGTDLPGGFSEPDGRKGPAEGGKEGCQFTYQGHIAARKEEWGVTSVLRTSAVPGQFVWCWKR